MRDVGVAGRYARALFLVSERRGETDRALEDLKGAAAVLAPGGAAARFFATPEVVLEVKRAALAKAFSGRVAPLVERFLDLLLRKKRLVGLETIASEFELIVERSKGIRDAHLVSAVPFTPAETERLHRELERQLGGQVHLTSEVDPALLGGALVRIGDRVIDRSVRGLLDALAERLHHVSV